MPDDHSKPKPAPGRLPTPSEILDAVAEGMNQREIMRKFFGVEPEHVGNEKLGELKPPKTPSRER